MQKGIGFIDNSGITEIHLGDEKLHLNRKRNSVFAENLLHIFKQERLIHFSYNLVSVNDCLSDTPEKANPDVNFSLQTLRLQTLRKLIFKHLNINSTPNKFDSLDGIRI